MTEPLIYTINGNVPVSSLRLEHGYDDNTEIKISFHYVDAPLVDGNKDPLGSLVPTFDKGGSITFWIKYFDIKTDELVRQDVHVLAMKGVGSDVNVGSIN